MEDSLLKRYKSKFSTNTISLVISSILTLLIPKFLGPAGYGNFNFLNSFFSKILGFLSLGTPLAFFTKLSQRQNEYKLIRIYIIFLFSILVFTIVSIIVIYLTDYDSILFVKIPYNFVLLAFVYSFLLFLVEIVRKINDALAFTYFSENTFVISRILILILIALFIYLEIFNLLIYYYILILGFSILLIVWFYYLSKNEVKPLNIKYKLDNKSFKGYFSEFYIYSSPLFIVGIFALISGFGERWILQYYGGSIEQGYYSFSYAFASIIFLFTGSMSPLFTREFSIAWINKDFIQMRKLYNKIIPLLIIVATYLSFFVVFNSNTIVKLILGDSYADAAIIISIMALYPIHQTYGQLLGSIIYGSGNTKFARNVSVPCDVLGLFATLILLLPNDSGGFEMSSVGLAYKMVIFQIIVVNIYLYYCTNLLKISFWNSLKFQLIIIFSFAFLAFINHKLSINITDSDVFQLFINFITYSISCILFFILFPSLIPLTKNDYTSFKNTLNLKK